MSSWGPTSPDTALSLFIYLDHQNDKLDHRNYNLDHLNDNLDHQDCLDGNDGDYHHRHHHQVIITLVTSFISNNVLSGYILTR